MNDFISEAKLYLLGSPIIERNGNPIHVDTRKAVALLAYLVMTRDSHRRDSLAALFWPENDQSGAFAALRRTLSALKRSMGDECLVITRESIGVSPGICLWLDVDEFKSAISSGLQQQANQPEKVDRCIHFYEKAIELYRDDFMAGFSLRDSPGFDDWQFFQAETLRVHFAEVLHRLADLYNLISEHQKAIEAARRWLNLDLLREEAHQLLMKLYAWSGQRNAALRQYRECVRVLEKELRVSPLEETTLLYQKILENQLLIPETSDNSYPSTPVPQEIEIKQSNFLTPIKSRLIGRTWDLDTLYKAYFDNRDQGYFFAIEGEVGIGKTRLANEFIEIAIRNGAQVISTQCYQGESHLAYGPIIDGIRNCLADQDSEKGFKNIAEHWLKEASRLFPEFSAYSQISGPTAPVDTLAAQSHFFESIRQVILNVCLSDKNGVLFMDDMHWADESTLDLLSYLVRRLRGTPLFVLLSWRSAEIHSGHRLRNLMSEASRSNYGTILSLERLTTTDLADLVKESISADIDLPDGFINRLYEETEGLPFFAVEYIDNAIHNQLTRNSLDWSIPNRVIEVLNSRFSVLDDTAQQILATAATIGRSFDFYTIRMVSGRSENETIKGLESLINNGIILERTPSKQFSAVEYDFTHDKLRTVAYQEVSLTRRRMLHNRVAMALIEKNRHNLSIMNSGQIAQHFELAGDDEKAAEYYKIAGEHDQEVFANYEALVNYQKALALNHPQKVKLHDAIGDLYTLTGDYRAAITSYQTAASLSYSDELSQLERKLGNIYHRLGEWELAICHFEAALGELDSSADQINLVSIYSDWSSTLSDMGYLDQAKELAQLALQHAENADHPLALAQAYNILGILALGNMDLDISQEYLENSLAKSRIAKNPRAEVAALNNLAHIVSRRGDHNLAIELTETAIDICAHQGDRHHEAALYNNLADLYHAIGQSNKAMDNLMKAVTIFSEIGLESGNYQPEIWKLTNW